MLQQYKARNYQAVLANWSLDTFKVDPTPLFSCAQARVANSANRTGYCNPQADRLMEQGLATTDPAQAKQIWAQYSQILQQDQPITFLWWSEDLAGLGPRPQGVETDVRSKIVNIRDWWIPANRQRYHGTRGAAGKYTWDWAPPRAGALSRILACPRAATPVPNGRRFP